MAIISEKEYNAEVRKQKKEQVREVHNAPGSATMVIMDAANELMKIDRSKPYEFKINGQTQSVQLNKPTSYSVFNDSEYLIVNDQDFENTQSL